MRTVAFGQVQSRRTITPTWQSLTGLSSVVLVLAISPISPTRANGQERSTDKREQQTPVAPPREELSKAPGAPGAVPQVPSSVRNVKEAVRRSARQIVLDLEDAIAQAELVIAVRLVDISELKIVHGGKMESVTQQFKFEPVRTLKGIFARDALLLTGDDLRIYQFGAAANQIDRGQMLLLMLGRSGPGYFNCNSAGSLEQSIPRLSGPADSLLKSIEALIEVTQRRDREARVNRLLDGLKGAKGTDAIPLLMSLRRRAMLAVQTPGVFESVRAYLQDQSPAVREVAARTLTALLDADYLQQHAIRESATRAIIAALDETRPDLQERVATLEALGSAGRLVQQSKEAQKWLQVDRPTRSFAERTSQIRAIGQIGLMDQKDAIARLFDTIPYEAPPEIQAAVGEVLVQLDSAMALDHVTKRLAEKYNAGLSIALEIELVGRLPAAKATPILLEISRRNLEIPERLAFAIACAKIADPRLVPTLGELLDPRQQDVRWNAVEALRKIDTDEAASTLFPHLREEGDLVRKLQLAEFLGRHGFRGGYPYAIEHMSSPLLREYALDVLAAVREPKAIVELRKIWETSHDVAWDAAAIRALGRLGQADIVPRLLPIANDPKNPLAPSALLALSDLGIADAIPVIHNSLASRSDEVVVAAAQAAQKLLSRPGVKADDVRERLSALLADVSASVPVRTAALQTLVALEDARLGSALTAAARDANLENTDLIRQVEERLAARKERLNLP